MKEPCQVRGCTKIGKRRVLTDTVKHRKWVYFVCDHHFDALPDSDLHYIARNHGKKSR